MMFGYIHQFKSLDMEFLKTIQFVRTDAIEDANKDEHLLEWMHSPLDDNKPRYIFAWGIYKIDKMAEICKKVSY